MMNDLTINEFGTIKLDGETLLLNGVAIPCGVNNDGDKNTAEMVNRWNSYGKNQELIAKQAEQIEVLRAALTEIAKLPEVRMDEGQYVACRALGQAFKG